MTRPEPEKFSDADLAAMLTLFRPDFYANQTGKSFESAEEALEDYLEHGWRLGYRAHPMFSESYYLAANPDLDWGDVMAPLHHYVLYGVNEGRKPHPLFARKRSFGPKVYGSWGSAMTYGETRIDKRPKVSRFFSPRWYKLQLAGLDWSTIDPLDHYLTQGARAGLSPFPSMDPEYYSRSAMTDVERQSMTVLEHFELCPEPRPKTFEMFDVGAYHVFNADISGMCAVSHFAEYGVWERRRFSHWHSQAYIEEQHPTQSFADRPAIAEYIRSGMGRRRRVIFVGHEGSRTGAPGILLKLVEQISSIENLDCFSIIDQDGPLVERHARVSHTLVPTTPRTHAYYQEGGRARFMAELDALLEGMEDNLPVVAICNAAESRLYADFFASKNIPVIMLMHELATFYPPLEMINMEESADLLVFPSQFVADAMRRAVPGARKNAKVIPQGLLRETYGLRAGGDRAEVFAPYGDVSDQDVLVTGCGTLDGRKGFDLFVETARRVRQLAPEARIKFAWVGGRKNWQINNGAAWDTTAFWAHWDLMSSNMSDDILMVSEVPDTEPFLANSDLFLMTSRADPFPCVVHEAMASKLPIISFSNAGGAPEAFLPDAGLTVPYHDTDAMALAVIALAADPERRAAMGKIGEARVREKYVFDDYTARLLSEACKVAGLAPKELGELGPKKTGRGRIYFTVPTWSVSGVNTMTEALVNDLNNKGFEAEILITTGRFGVAQKPGGDVYDVKPQHFPNAPYRVLHPYSMEYAVRQSTIEQFLVRNAPCVFVPGFDYVASEVAHRLPPTVGIVGVAHSDDREHYEHARRSGHLWNSIVAVSAEIKRGLLRVNSDFADRLEVIRYGLPAPNPSRSKGLVAKKIADASPIRLVYAGRFETYQKRIADYPKLAVELGRLGVDYELVMIGEGTKENAIVAAMDEEITAGRVRLPGRLSNEDTLEEFDAAHIVLILSDFEGLPLALIEGVQRGCIPIVYEMKSGIPEVIEDGKNGFIVAKGDIAAVAARVKQIQADPKLRKRMCDAALSTAQKRHLTLSDMGAGYEKIFEKVLTDVLSGDRSRQALRRLVGS